MAELTKDQLVKLMLANTRINQGLKFLHDSGWTGRYVDEIDCESALIDILEQIRGTLKNANRQAIEHNGKNLSQACR